jgi:hypothetical protein
MSRVPEEEIVRIDAALKSLQKQRRKSTDPADSLRVSESIDVRLDERLRLMRDRDHTSAKRKSTGVGRGRYRQGTY